MFGFALAFKSLSVLTSLLKRLPFTKMSLFLKIIRLSTRPMTTRLTQMNSTKYNCGDIFCVWYNYNLKGATGSRDTIFTLKFTAVFFALNISLEQIIAPRNGIFEVCFFYHHRKKQFFFLVSVSTHYMPHLCIIIFEPIKRDTSFSNFMCTLCR